MHKMFTFGSTRRSDPYRAHKFGTTEEFEHAFFSSMHSTRGILQATICLRYANVMH